MKALIPAAGYATRLYPLTENTPKALLEVKGKPMLEHVIKQIESIPEIDAIYIITNAKFHGSFENWARHFKCAKKIKILNDGTTSNEDRLGAIGDLMFAIEREKIDDELLIIASDNLFETPLKEIYDYYKQKNAPVIALYDIKTEEAVKPFGVVLFDANKRIIDFEEKPAEPKSTYAATLVYFITKDSTELIKRYLQEGNKPDRTGDFIAWLYKKQPVYAFILDKWYDIGSLETLEKARREFNG